MKRTPLKDMDALQRQIHHWQRKAFPVSDDMAKWHHLDKEIDELYQALLGNKSVAEELADCFLLLSGIASLNKISLHEAAKRKLAVNKKRKWGKPDVNGVVEHIKEPHS